MLATGFSRVVAIGQAVVLAGALGLAREARANVVIDRNALNLILGGLAVAENFEAYQVATGNAELFSGVNTFTALTTLTQSPTNIQGPGLVTSGVTFSGTNLQWNAVNYYGAPSDEILFNGNTLTVDFATPTVAFGVDLRDFVGFSASAVVTVFAANNTTVLYTTTLNLIGVPVFFGFQDAGGIGRVTFMNQSQSWSPIIDNLAFSAIPEPSVVVLLGLGLAAGLLALGRTRPGRGAPTGR